MTRASYGAPRHFTVTAAATAVAGIVTLTIKPAITFSGAFANVDSQPAANAAVVFDAAAGTQSPQAIAFSPQALTWACVNQEQPGGVDTVYFATDPKTGIQLRFIRQFEGRTNNFINRFDVLYAFGVPYSHGRRAHPVLGRQEHPVLGENHERKRLIQKPEVSGRGNQTRVSTTSKTPGYIYGKVNDPTRRTRSTPTGTTRRAPRSTLSKQARERATKPNLNNCARA